MTYQFISLDSKTEELKTHLREVCGIEKSGNKKELIAAIIEYEKTNGLERPQANVHNGDRVENDTPLRQQRKVKIKIAESNGDRTDVYVAINDWDALIKRNVEVEVYESVYELLANSGDTTFEQNKDGSLTEVFVPRYNITFIGYAD